MSAAMRTYTVTINTVNREGKVTSRETKTIEAETMKVLDEEFLFQVYDDKSCHFNTVGCIERADNLQINVTSVNKQ